MDVDEMNERNKKICNEVFEILGLPFEINLNPPICDCGCAYDEDESDEYESDEDDEDHVIFIGDDDEELSNDDSVIFISYGDSKQKQARGL